MGQPFPSDAVGGTTLLTPAIQSPNFSQSAKTGWAILQNGNAYFYNITAEGTISTTVLVASGTGEGVFCYSGSPAAGNLTASVAQAGGTDSYGNNYVAGLASYGSGYYSQLGSGFIVIGTGSLAGGWTQQATIETSVSGGLFLSTSSGAVNLAAPVSVDGGTNLPVSVSMPSYPFADDPFSGSSWGSGERADYINDLRSQINNLIAGLVNANVITVT